MARAFIGTWVARFGTPSDLSWDRGSQFTSELWNVVAEGLPVKLHCTTAYHPQANGLCERFHRSMKAALRASLKDGDWVDRLPWVMLGLRCAPKEDLQSSSAEQAYGQALRVPGFFIPNSSIPWSVARQRSSLLEAAKVFTPVPTSQHGTPTFRMPPDLCVVDYVFIRHDAHHGPYALLTMARSWVLRHGNKCLVVDVGGRPETISWDLIKPANVDVSRPMEVVQPPCRGRLPAPHPPLTVETPSTLLTSGASRLVDGTDVPAASAASTRHLHAPGSGRRPFPSQGL